MGNCDVLSFIEGCGNSNSTKYYTFTDHNVKIGKYYYRLRQTDFDGRVQYSDVIEVEVSQLTPDFILLQNYPNPFNPTTKIIYHTPVQCHHTLKVIDILGRQIKILVD